MQTITEVHVAKRDVGGVDRNLAIQVPSSTKPNSDISE